MRPLNALLFVLLAAVASACGDDGIGGFRQPRPDLSVSLEASFEFCPSALVLTATVENRGRASAPANLIVEFFQDAPPPEGPRLAVSATTEPLAQGASQTFEFAIDAPVEPTSYYAIVNRGNPVPEFVHTNDTGVLHDVRCGALRDPLP